MYKKRFFAALAACILLLAATVHFYKEDQDARLTLADHNLSAWNSLYWLAHDAGNYASAAELSNSNFAARHNAIVYHSVVPHLTPRFDSNTFGFLTSEVDLFVRLLTQADPNNEVTQKSFTLFQNLAEEIESIASRVADHVKQGEKERLELIDPKSEIYQQLTQQIAACIDTYLEDIVFLTPRLSYIIENPSSESPV